jgi:hypothetical protein
MFICKMFISGYGEGTFEDEAGPKDLHVLYEMELWLKLCAKNGRRGKKR